MNLPDVERRLEALERQAAEAEKTIEELNAVVIEQARTLARMSRLLDAAQDQLETVEHLARGTTREPPPPHY